MQIRSKILSAVVLLFLICFLVSSWYFFFKTPKKIQDAPQIEASAQTLRQAKSDWQQRIVEIGPEKAYTEFLAKASTLPLGTHNQAHAFGEALYAVEGLSGLRYCDSSFEFGCYHSFFGIAVAQEGIGVLSKFDEACKSAYPQMYMPCQHGIGHGVLVYTDYTNLVDALKLCETVSTLPTGGCSSGVFMENNFHTMDASADTAHLRTAGDNLYAPCDTLPERFQASCYFEQVQWWQNVFNNDFEHIGKLCAALSSSSAAYVACYSGIGNYVATFVDHQYQGIINLCSTMPNKQTEAYCHEGASWLLLSKEETKDSAHTLCSVLQEPYKTTCLQKL